MALSPINVLSICSGVGGLELGLRLAEPAARTVCHVEREAYAAAILAARMEDETLDEAPVWSDLATFDGRAWRGAVDIVISGDPCQPNSVAGQGKGSADDRWLIDHVLRAFEESGASRLFRENVSGNADGQLDALVGPLERMGCDVAAGIFSARETGASHRRERLFIMADRRRHGRERWTRPIDLQCATSSLEGEARKRERRRVGAVSERNSVANPRDRLLPQPGRGQEERDGAGPAGAAVADRCNPRLQGQPAAQSARPDHGNPGRVCGTDIPLFAPGPYDPSWQWIIERRPDLAPAVPKCRVRGMADGLAYRVDRLRACGNGVHPLAAAVAYLSLDAHFRA